MYAGCFFFLVMMGKLDKVSVAQVELSWSLQILQLKLHKFPNLRSIEVIFPICSDS